MARILKGKEVADAIDEKTLKTIEELKNKGITPTLAIFRVGEKGEDISYEKGTMKKCAKLGVNVRNFIFDNDVTVEEFYEKLEYANENSDIHGILVFRPLPKDRFDDERLRNSIHPNKDVDGCSDLSLAGTFTNRYLGFPACTARASIEILNHYNIPVEGKNVVVIGRSLVIGKPVSMMLLNRNATVTICHTKTKDLAKICSEAEILICSAGRAEMVTKEFTNPNQVIIDVGINYHTEKQKLTGDVLFEEVEPLVDSITPVPGGVGSVTTSILLNHVVEACVNKI